MKIANFVYNFFMFLAIRLQVSCLRATLPEMSINFIWFVNIYNIIIKNLTFVACDSLLFYFKHPANKKYIFF